MERRERGGNLKQLHPPHRTTSAGATTHSGVERVPAETQQTERERGEREREKREKEKYFKFFCRLYFTGILYGTSAVMPLRLAGTVMDSITARHVRSLPASKH